MTRSTPDFFYETEVINNGAGYVAGVDEVGRGPFVGPVLAAAVRLDPDHIPEGLNDSKVLSSKKRAALSEQIIAHADVYVAQASVEEIDQLNILHATMLAMERAVLGLPQRADHVFVDGNRVPAGLRGRATGLVKGDARSVSISAASIVAKVARDQLMVDLAQQYPGYGWERNAGYGTLEHRLALRNLGITPHHRRSFKPIHNILYQEKIVSD